MLQKMYRYVVNANADSRTSENDWTQNYTCVLNTQCCRCHKEDWLWDEGTERRLIAVGNHTPEEGHGDERERGHEAGIFRYNYAAYFWVPSSIHLTGIRIRWTTPFRGLRLWLEWKEKKIDTEFWELKLRKSLDRIKCWAKLHRVTRPFRSMRKYRSVEKPPFGSRSTRFQ